MGDVQNLDGAVMNMPSLTEVSKFQVWTNSLGKEILEEMGFIGEDG